MDRSDRSPTPYLSASRHFLQDAAAAVPTLENLLRSAGESTGSSEAADTSGLGIYLHIPFCFHKCHYCDFYSLVDTADRQNAFVDRMIDEMNTASDLCPVVPVTIFAGGGTPTLLTSSLWQKLLAAMDERFDLSACREFTVEANPETVTPELMDILVAGGVNRISIGTQSFNTSHLKTLERWHDPQNVTRAVELARAAGIENFNLDLIFGIPRQSLDEWLDDLHRALAHEPTHLSCYGLTFEPNTPMTQKLKMGRIKRTDEEIEARMFRATIDVLKAAGFEHYEISNFALPGRRCEHNLLYWSNRNWLAFGPSASGHWSGVRWKNAGHLGKYLATRGLSPIESSEQLDADASLGEELMVKLRLIEGIDWHRLRPRLDDRRRGAIDGMIDMGMLEIKDARLRLTDRGLMVADSVLGELL